MTKSADKNAPKRGRNWTDVRADAVRAGLIAEGAVERARSAENDARRIAAEREVRDRFPGLMHERSRLRMAGIEPSRVLLPARLNVPYDGEDATDFEGSCMGLPITWSEREEWGLIVTLPEPRMIRVIPPDATDS